MKPRIKVGDRFGKLLVVGVFQPDRPQKHKKWHCLCDCGSRTTPFQFSLTSGKSKSCGCIAAEKSRIRWSQPQPELRAKLSERAGSATHRMSKHPGFRSWVDMRARCSCPTNKWWPSYGGRGISVCTAWDESFETFWADLGDTWFKGAQLGRIDNAGGYTKENCRWETAKQQQNNKSNNVFVETPSGRMTVSQAAEKYRLTHGCVNYRAKQGYSPNDLVKPSERAK